MSQKKPSKKTLVTAARREYNQLRREYHKVGRQVLGTPKNAKIRRAYATVKREVNKVGRRLGMLTGAHRGR